MLNELLPAVEPRGTYVSPMYPWVLDGGARGEEAGLLQTAITIMTEAMLFLLCFKRMHDYVTNG